MGPGEGRDGKANRSSYRGRGWRSMAPRGRVGASRGSGSKPKAIFGDRIQGGLSGYGVGFSRNCIANSVVSVATKVATEWRCGRVELCCQRTAAVALGPCDGRSMSAWRRRACFHHSEVGGHFLDPSFRVSCGRVEARLDWSLKRPVRSASGVSILSGDSIKRARSLARPRPAIARNPASPAYAGRRRRRPAPPMVATSSMPSEAGSGTTDRRSPSKKVWLPLITVWVSI